MIRIFCLIAVGMLGMFLLASCASPRLDVEYDRHHDFSDLHTFGIATEPNESAEKLPPGWRSLKTRMTQAVVAKMESAGFKMVEGEQPDFMIALHIVGPQRVTREIDATAISSSYFFEGRYITPRLEHHHFREGTLVIDMLDPDDNSLLWRGWAARPVDSPDVADDTFQEAISGLLDRFPPH